MPPHRRPTPPCDTLQCEPKEGFSYGRIGIYRADRKVNCKCGKAGTALNCGVISVSIVLPRKPTGRLLFFAG